MPTYSIAGPDGKTYSIEGPEGASREQIIGKIKERLGPQQEQPKNTLMQSLFGGGPQPRHQLPPERIIRNIAGIPQEAYQSLKSFMTPQGPPGSRELTAGAVEPAIELASLVSPMGPETRLAKSAARSALTTAEKSQPDLQRLFESASADYKAIDELGLKFRPEAFNTLADTIHANAVKANFRDYASGPQAALFKTVEEMRTVYGKEGEIKSQPASYGISELDQIRQRINNIPAKEPADIRAQNFFRGQIDKYIDTMKANDFAQFPANAEKAKALFSTARQKWNAASRLKDIQTMRESAESRSAIGKKNVAEKLRDEFRWVVDPHYPERRKGWTKEEIEQIQNIVKGNFTGNIANLVSKLNLYHPLTGWGPAILAELAGTAKGIPGAGLATLGAGHVASKIAERVPEKQASVLEDMIWRRSPLGAEEATKASVVGKSAKDLRRMSELEALIRMLGPATGAMQPREQQ